MSHQAARISLPSSEQFHLNNNRGETYLIQLSWPLHWQNDRTSARSQAPIMYIVDGNTLFLTATEAAWRREDSAHFSGGGIIVAIGYPLDGRLYDPGRRTCDLTLPTQPPTDGAGGADEFLNFIVNDVRSAVRLRFPGLCPSREALHGHSYGGLFALHALFTRPNLFDCYMASSPSIWWDNRSILREAKSFMENEVVSNEAHPSVMLFFGSLEQNPRRWDNESFDDYERRKQMAAQLRMEDNVHELYETLQGSASLHTISLNRYEDEGHIGVMTCSMNRSLTAFFEDWPFHQQ